MISSSAASGVRSFKSSSVLNNKVAVLGAAGGIGQPMSLLLKMSPRVKELNLFDIVNTPGVAADLSHIDTASNVKGFKGTDELDAALDGCDVVVIPAGVPRKPGMTRDDLFNTNASIVQSLIEGCARSCPNASILIIANPVNSTVPIAAEVLKKAGVYNPKKLFGVTTLDVVRANKFVSEVVGKEVTDVTVVGGHAGITILPLLANIEGLNEEQIGALTHRIQFGGDEVVQAKDGAGSATLSMAVAGARFAERVCAALDGEKGVNECAFVESDIAGTGFFSSRVDIDASGVSKIYPVGPMSDFEQANFDKMVPDLKGQVAKGVAFVNK